MRLLSSLLQKCKVFTFHEMFSGVWQEISQGPKCTSQIWRCAVIGLSFQEVFIQVCHYIKLYVPVFV